MNAISITSSLSLFDMDWKGMQASSRIMTMKIKKRLV